MTEITDDQIGYAAIKEASRSQTLSSYPFDQMSVGFGFEKGAKWMQEQIKPEWISVEDRLPENSSSVLIVLEDIQDGELFVSIGRYIKAEWSFLPDPADCISVTYWMPLPEAPTA